MSTSSLDSVCACASELARHVGVRIRESLASRDTFRVEKKGPRDLVTEIDIWSEQEIMRGVAKRFPEHLVIGEESLAETLKKEQCTLEQLLAREVSWVVDPIDGTTNFANGIPQVGVSIAVLERGERKVGVVYDPARDELFTAIKGSGAFLNGKKISVRQKDAVMDAVIATGFPYERNNSWHKHRELFEAALLGCRDLRRFGAATLDQCWVACGRLDAFFEQHLKAWDVAAASLIVEEAGGQAGHFIEDIEGRFSLTADSFLFANRPLYPKIKEILVAARDRGGV